MQNRPQAKPFLKWAGGKTQLLAELSSRLPDDIKEKGLIKSYIEPFLGGGAFFFYLRKHYEIRDAYLLDLNRELILTYKVVQEDPDSLISYLNELEEKYRSSDKEGRRKLFYQIRTLYNKQMKEINHNDYSLRWVERAGQLIFLNKTCYNGLFRQNKKGEFNVPHGRYKNPTICDVQNLREVSLALQGVKLIQADFLQAKSFVQRKSFVYFDPPYRPLSATSNFTSYAKEDFDDADQLRLANLFIDLDKAGASLMLSNSDPKNSDETDNFFDELYGGFSIERVLANRNINRDGKGRGKVTELIIRNY
ncbi:MAG: DNA adenine methylase [Bacillota bacterium]|nr:DNA adenine methylase [Bacillota bacterium]